MVDAYTWNSTIWRLPPPIRDDWLSSRIVMENPNHLNEPNEAILEVNLVVPEPNQVADIHDPNEMVEILDDIDLVDYDEEDPEEDPKEEPKRKMLILSLRMMLNTAGTTTQKPYAIRDFPRGLFEVGELSSARDSSNVDGLVPWALRHDLEASRVRARVMEAELGTCQTEIALLKSKDKIREKERELLNHDLENVERALGNVLERMSVLESGENATLKKRLVETETKLAWARMERETAERRIMPPKSMSEACMHEIIMDQVTTSMAEFVANINRGTGGAGAGGAGASGAGAGGARAGSARADGAGAGGAGASGAGAGGARAGSARADGAGAGGAGVGGAEPAAPEITRIKRGMSHGLPPWHSMCTLCASLAKEMVQFLHLNVFLHDSLAYTLANEKCLFCQLRFGGREVWEV
nr:hypothetical protein [Tanacetum cinerariifolium]